MYYVSPSLIDEFKNSLPATSKLPKVINARTHGMIDYSHAAFFLTMALVWRRTNKRAALAALGTGAFVLVQSLLTDYPLGAAPVLSFETHGKMDGAFASGGWLLPRVLGFADTPEARVFELNSAVEGTIVALTDFDSQRARQAK